MTRAALVRLTTPATELAFELTPARVHREYARVGDQGDQFNETLRLRVPFDATVRMERDAAPAHGIRPELAALERFMRGRELLLFIWGARVQLVRMEALRIREQEFSPALEPIRAVARIDLRVVDASQLGAAGRRPATILTSQLAHLELSKQVLRNNPI
jgi:hypothetical protein